MRIDLGLQLFEFCLLQKQSVIIVPLNGQIDFPGHIIEALIQIGKVIFRMIRDLYIIVAPLQFGKPVCQLEKRLADQALCDNKKNNIADCGNQHKDDGKHSQMLQ